MDRIESSEIDSHNIVKWSLTKEQRQFKREKTFILTNSTGTISHLLAGKKKNLDTDFTSFTKINSKCF